MIEENEAPEVHEGSGRREKWHRKVSEHTQKKGGGGLLVNVQAPVQSFFVPPEGQEDGEADSIFTSGDG